MRVLLFSDVHGNLEALESVLADASKHGFDRAVCLGDTVGYGADPGPCVSAVSALPKGAAVLGNHDAAVLDRRGRAYLNPAAQAGVKYSEKELSTDHVDYLKSLPLLIETAEFAASHASPHRPSDWLYVLDPPEAREALRATQSPVVFIGHTHFPLAHDGSGRVVRLTAARPLRLRTGERWLVNVGSVGQPRDGDPRAAYVIYDDAERIVRLFRVDYDVDAAAAKILDAGLPAILADRLRRGC